MFFTSFGFLLFLGLVFLLYWFVFNKTAKTQNILLLTASLFFYGRIDFRFLGLLLFSALFNYFIGLNISKTDSDKLKSRLLWLGVIVNVLLLGFFKYYNFFLESFFNLFNIFGADLVYNPLHIILPLGISFFTFQTLGYIIDVYNEKIEPSRNILEFTTYVVYFPKILAGPIERAQRFLPQIEVKRFFDYSLATNGLRQILLGFFKKVVIADSCALIVNPIFENYQDYSGSTLLLGLFFYLFQIYCDFSGYSDLAIGFSKLFGIKLMQNFASPFFAVNISDFWRRWHISLTTWMMDYIFTPLSFLLRRLKKVGLILSIIATFIVVGLWHGANWTFIFYGLLHGLYFIPIVLKGTVNKPLVIDRDRRVPSLNDLVSMSGMFILLMLTVVFFRIDSVLHAFDFLSKLFSQSLFSMPTPGSRLKALLVLLSIIFLIFMEWKARGEEHVFANLRSFGTYTVRWSFYLLIIVMVMILSSDNEQQFIYSQF